MNYNINSVYFSPSGTTRRVVNSISAAFCGVPKVYDMLQNDASAQITFATDDVVVVGVPVFSGRVAPVCLRSLHALHGSQTPAIICVVYGNREYEDALLELQDIMESQGFVVFAAAAVVAQHSIFPKVATGRPDQSDIEKISKFAELCIKELATFNISAHKKLEINGNHPYRDAGNPPLKPSGSARCNGCGKCVNICPTHAINIASPRKTDAEKCVSCTACIAICPQNARAFRGAVYKVAAAGFATKNSERKEPEIFI